MSLDALETFLEEQKQNENGIEIETNNLICKQCNALLDDCGNDNYICNNCGIIKTIHSEVYTADVKEKEYLNILNDLQKYNQKSEFKLPEAILNKATYYAHKVLSKKIKRGNPRKGIYCYCLELACLENGIFRQPSELALFVDTTDLVYFNNKKIVELELNMSITDLIKKEMKEIQFLKRCIEVFQIPKIYQDKISGLIARLEESYLYACTKKDTKWKCCLSYVLIYYMNLNPKDIFDQMGIKKTMFEKFRLVICNHSEEFAEFWLPNVKERIKII